jgi:ectoine hydroxylase-related dioxygenase (phytanoyl-CoA dioxygenase family)
MTAQQIQNYATDGFLLLPEAVDKKIVARARHTLTAQIPKTQASAHHQFVSDPSVLACFSKNLCAAAAELAGTGKTLGPPATVCTITVFPTLEQWEWPAPHIDHAKEEDAHQTLPPPYRIACLIYLTDTEPHCGGTVVWPGSHRRLQELAASNHERYKYLAALNGDISQLDLGAPKEITAQAGDALLYQYLCTHAGSSNTGTEPRFALSHKW